MTEDKITIPEDKLLSIAPERRETDRRKRTSELAERAKKKAECSSTASLCYLVIAILFFIPWIVMLVIAPWIMGVVIAVGWMKLVAAFIFPYAWYLTAEHLMRIFGLL